MKCVECGSANFEIKKVRFTPVIKNHKLEVVIPCYVCKECNSPFMDTAQVNTMRRVASDLYRKEQHLLTSEEIIKYRSDLGFSQAAFANYLKVGEASIRRWESHSIQDDGQDDHIRTKCDLDVAEENYFYVLARTEKPNLYNGNRKFSADLFDQVSAFFLHLFSVGYDVLDKLHFYADFLHFNRTRHSITGIKYVPMRQGPTPCKLKMFGSELFDLKRPDSFQPTGLDNKELSTLETVAKYFESMGENEFCTRSRKEKGFLESKDCEFITYDYAKYLLFP